MIKKNVRSMLLSNVIFCLRILGQITLESPYVLTFIT